MRTKVPMLMENNAVYCVSNRSLNEWLQQQDENCKSFERDDMNNVKSIVHECKHEREDSDTIDRECPGFLNAFIPKKLAPIPILFPRGKIFKETHAMTECCHFIRYTARHFIRAA